MTDPREPLGPNRDDVGTLLRLAGKRLPVSSERTERVRAAARAQWQAEIMRRSRRRVAWAAAAALAASVILAVVIVGRRDAPDAVEVPVPPEPPAVVETRVGGVRITGVGAGDAVPWGSEVETDATGLAALRMPFGHAVRIGRSSSVRLHDPRSLELTRGVVYVDSGFSEVPARAVSVRTPFGDVTEVGTRFEVRVGDEAVRIRVREGRVGVRAAGRHLAIEGPTELEIAADGTESRRALAPHDPGWDWLLEITPVPDFDGEPARSFLEWAARERGLSLAFSDAETERIAEAAVLRGSFERLRLDEALDAAVAASGLACRIEAGVLVVSAP